MKIKAVILAALVMFGTVKAAEANHDGVALGLGIAGLALGAAIAHRQYYAPYPYYGPTYYAPSPYYYGPPPYSYGPTYYAPRYGYRHYRRHHHYRHHHRHHH